MLEALHTLLATSDVLPGPYRCKVRALLEELVDELLLVGLTEIAAGFRS